MEDTIPVHVIDGLAELVHVQLHFLLRQVALAVWKEDKRREGIEGGERREGREGGEGRQEEGRERGERGGKGGWRVWGDKESREEGK